MEENTTPGRAGHTSAECHLVVALIMVGGGTPVLPAGVRLTLDLLDERRFGNGMAHLHYRITP